MTWKAFFYVLFVLFCFYPYEFYSVYLRFLPDGAHYTAFAFLMLTFVLVVIKCGMPRFPRVLTTAMLIQGFGYLFVCAVHNDILEAIGALINMALAAVLISFIESNGGLVNFFRKYNRWILIMAIMGVTAWLMITFLGFEPLFSVADRADGRIIYNFGLTFSKTAIWLGNIRYAGFFDEAGAMGYWGLYALIINRLFVGNKRLETILIICLLLTFSVGFFVQLALYLLLFGTGQYKTRLFLPIIGVIVIALLIKSTEGTEYAALYESSFGRVENMMETGGLAVDNREELVNTAKKEFLDNPLLGTDKTNVYIGDNAYETLAKYGIIGSLFVLSPFIILLVSAIKRKDTNLIKASLVLFAGFTHRPFHTALLYFFMIYALLLMSEQIYKSRNPKQLAYK